MFGFWAIVSVIPDNYTNELSLGHGIFGLTNLWGVNLDDFQLAIANYTGASSLLINPAQLLRMW